MTEKFGWKSVQAVSGLLFGIFVGLHLLNTWLAALGPDVYDGVQSALRPLLSGRRRRGAGAGGAGSCTSSRV